MSRKAALAAAVAACALAPSAARAGTYDMWSCRGPDGAPLGTGAWMAAGDARVDDTCAAGGSLRLSLPPGRLGTLRISAPPGARIAGYELWRSRAVAKREWFRASEAKVVESAGAATFTVDGGGTAGDPAQPLAAANRIAAQHAPLDALTLQVACTWWCGDAARFDLYRSRVTIDDPVAPAVSVSPGLVVTASDRGSGVAAVTLAIDGGPAQTFASACRPPYTVAPPCAAEVERAFSVDAVADGAHSAAGTVIDAAGNATAWGPLPFVVQHAAIVRTAAATPGAEPPVLRLARAAVVHPAGGAARLAGTLRTAAGAPIAGARLSVSSLDLAADDAQPRALAPVSTDAAGGFTLTLRRDGAQRITIAYGGAQATAIVRSRLALAVGARRGRLVKGRVLTLRGRLRGAGTSARGAVVAIESIVNGDWQPVGTTRARGDGSYRWTYRFVHLARDTIFSFRAVVERAPGWPWASEHSAVLKVRVDVP